MSAIHRLRDIAERYDIVGLRVVHPGEEYLDDELAVHVADAEVRGCLLLRRRAYDSDAFVGLDTDVDRDGLTIRFTGGEKTWQTRLSWAMLDKRRMMLLRPDLHNMATDGRKSWPYQPKAK